MTAEASTQDPACSQYRSQRDVHSDRLAHMHPQDCSEEPTAALQGIDSCDPQAAANAFLLPYKSRRR
jgi:hypothetical protein